MSRRRTRPDTSGKPGYITPDGYRRFEEEADRLWNVDRPKMAKAVQVAAAEGDRSENAEYQYSKQRLAAIDRRLRFLGRRLKVLTIVDEKPPDDGKVYFGSWVTIETNDGSTASSGLTRSTPTRSGSAWTRRSEGRFCPERSATRSQSGAQRARSQARSSPCAISSATSATRKGDCPLFLAVAGDL